MSATLGTPPPDVNADGIGQSLMTDRDEESILSDSYLDTIPPPLTVTISGGGKLGVAQKGNKNHGPQSTGIKMATSLVTRIAIEIAIGNVTGPKRAISDMVQNGPMGALHNAKTMMASAAVPASAKDCADMRVPSMTAKQSRDAGPVHRVATGGRSPPSIDLCCLLPYPIQHL